MGKIMDTILDVIHERAKARPESAAIMYKVGGRYVEVPWRDLFGRVETLACVLDDWGLRPGDRAAILCGTRWEWTAADLAVTMLGGIMVPVYPQLPKEDARYILEHCGAGYVFCEDQEQLRKVMQVRDGLDSLERVVVIDAPEEDFGGVETFDDMLDRGKTIMAEKVGLIEEKLRSIGPDDTMTIVYTSGTTGPPKGAVLACRGFEFNTENVSGIIDFQEGNRTIAYLPLAHVYERFVQYAALSRGVVYCYAESLEKLGDGLREIRPHLMPGVPRVYEKAHAGIMKAIDESGPVKRFLARWALGVGRRVFDAGQKDRNPGPRLRFSHVLADRLVFAKVRQNLGGRLRSAIVAAAPVSPELCAFFQSLGVPLVEGWGMTETTAPATLNPIGMARVGTAGVPFEGLELKLAEDGEILVRGPSVLKGYYRDEEATQEAFDEDGFLRTGDLGGFDEAGYLKITGRKKDILINSYGKNIAARNIEDRFMDDPVFSGCVVYGDGKKYLTAVLCLSSECGLDPTDTDTVAEVQRRVDRINDVLPNFEKVRGFVLVDHPFSVETGEITPTLKVKRAEVIRKHKRELDALYDD